MNNLGLSQLTDDQLLELLMEMCAELSNRDPIVRKAAQGCITDGATRLKAKREAVHKAVAKARKRYIHQIQQDVIASIDAEFEKGDFPLFSAEEEAKHIYNATQKRKGELRQAKKAEIEDRIRMQLRDDVLAGTVKLFSVLEEQKIITEATDTAANWLKQHGTISFEQFQKARNTIVANLEKMGHKFEDIMKLYGKP